MSDRLAQAIRLGLMTFYEEEHYVFHDPNFAIFDVHIFADGHFVDYSSPTRQTPEIPEFAGHISDMVKAIGESSTKTLIREIGRADLDGRPRGIYTCLRILAERKGYRE